jgi:hypothetical protein
MAESVKKLALIALLYAALFMFSCTAKPKRVTNNYVPTIDVAIDSIDSYIHSAPFPLKIQNRQRVTMQLASRGGYQIHCTFDDNSSGESLRFVGYDEGNLSLTKFYYDNEYSFAEKIARAKVGSKEFLAFFKSLFDKFNQYRILSIVIKEAYTSILTEVEGKSFLELMKDTKGEYYDKGYNISDYYKRCECPLKYRYEVIFINKDLEKQLLDLKKEKYIEKYRDNIYISHDVSFSNFDHFSDTPSCDCPE